MDTIRNGDELLLILPDNTALSFRSAPRERSRVLPHAEQTLRQKIGAFFSALKPRIARAFPVETRLASGRRFSLMVPRVKTAG